MLREAARGVVGGAVGTGAMALTARLHRELHARRDGIRVDEIEEILDYDDSEHVVIAASTLLQHVIGWAPRSARGRQTLFWLVHWGYGSAVGVGHVALRRVLGREPGPGWPSSSAARRWPSACSRCSARPRRPGGGSAACW